jgi:hypothetical protein
VDVEPSTDIRGLGREEKDGHDQGNRHRKDDDRQGESFSLRESP